jgi:sec-independent protein translocase protein TatA
MGLRMPELIVILLIVIVLFGASKLPQLGAGLGQGIKSFKKAISDSDDDKTSGAKSTTTDAGSKQV